MSKKDFSKGLDSLLGEGSTTKKAKPQTPVQSKTREIRATFIVNEAKLEKIKSLARTEGILIKDILDKALENFISKWEAKHGKIKKPPINKNLERLKDL